MALHFVRESKHNKEDAWAFDYVFVDEVQDLKPVGLRLCAALCRNESNLYLTADMNQKLYGRGISWGSVVETLRFRGDEPAL